MAEHDQQLHGPVAQVLLRYSSDLMTIIGPDGEIRYDSPSLERILGWRAGERIGRNTLAMIHPDDRARVRQALQRRLVEPDLPAAATEFRLQRRDGSWCVVESTAIPDAETPWADGILVNTRDITDRVRAEESRRRLAAVVESSQDGVGTVTLDGTVLSWNRAAERIYGYSAAEMIGQPVSRLAPPERKTELQHALDIIHRGGRVAPLETQRTRKDGREIYVSLSFSPVLDDWGAVTSVSIIGRDVTKPKEMERTLREAKHAAEAASRAKSEFLSAMSHELRTPLNSVIGFANVLRRNRAGHLDASELDYVERILANGKHLLSLINDILDLSRVEAGRAPLEYDDVSLARLVEETLAALQGAARPGVVLAVELPEPLAPLRTDERKLKQILINLVGNALKFTEAGQVTVAVDADAASGRPLALAVHDTGPGIAQHRLASIFDAFEQAESGTARRYGGTGLGLAICDSLTRLLYRIEVESEVDVGTTFRVVFPSGGGAPVG